MKPNEADLAIDSLIRDVVWGKKPWSDLRLVGVDVTKVGDQWNFPRRITTALKIEPKDLARGFVALEQRPSELREWAEFILAASDLVKFDPDDFPFGGEAMGVLWDLAFGDQVRPGTISRLKDLAAKAGP